MLEIEPRKTSGMTEFTVHHVKNSCEELSNLTYDQAMAVCELLAYVYNSSPKESMCRLLESVQDKIDSLTNDLDDMADDLRTFKSDLN